ncbi:MAG: hypothetical protein JWM80_2551 [Cyanobacteria bacterium RYN_339]|nr:hypothetical protein [Cyanobacteria bacterium RYN_339]
MTEATTMDKQVALARLTAFAGRWTGRTTLWMEPGTPPQEGDFTLTAEPAAEGEAVLVRYEGKHGDETAVGLAILGFDGDHDKAHLTWVDSFHTPKGPMVLTGALRDGVVFDVTGTWYWEGKPFGWRIEARMPDADTLDWRMFVQMGEESPATACTFKRA